MTRTLGDPNRDRVVAALRVLDLDLAMSWADMHRRYRAKVRASHPDTAPDPEAATAHTAELNVAWAVLVGATENGRTPLPTALGAMTPPPAVTQGTIEPLVTLHAQPGDVFVQLLEAAYAIGDVSYIDPEAGLIQVLLRGGPASAQLLIAVDTESDPASASFTLDSMHEAGAPEIRDVVAQLAEALSTR